MDLLLLAGAGAGAFVLARKLCGDAYCAWIAAAVYALSPPVRALAAADARLAGAAAFLPAAFLSFYRLSEVPLDLESPWPRRRALAELGAALAFLGALDPRFAAVAGLLLWLVLLSGYLLDSRRRSSTWGPAFGGLALASLAAILFYFPLWWWRRLGPGAAAGAAPRFAGDGADFLALLNPSPSYLGLAAAGLAFSGIFWTRSFRGQARLWAMLCGLSLWTALGPRFLLGGSYLWWVPVLYRGARNLPWLGDVPPPFFDAAGRLPLALLTAFGFGAVLTRLPAENLRWARPAGALLLTAALAADYLRYSALAP